MECMYLHTFHRYVCTYMPIGVYLHTYWFVPTYLLVCTYTPTGLYLHTYWIVPTYLLVCVHTYLMVCTYICTVIMECVEVPEAKSNKISRHVCT